MLTTDGRRGGGGSGTGDAAGRGCSLEAKTSLEWQGCGCGTLWARVTRRQKRVADFSNFGVL